MNNFKSSPDSRRHKRWDIFEYALVTRQNGDAPEPAVIVDLSLGGFQARSKLSYTVGETVIIKIANDDFHSIEVSAEVRYSNPLPGTDLMATGLRFTPETAEQRVSLVNFLHERFQADIQRLSI